MSSEVVHKHLFAFKNGDSKQKDPIRVGFNADEDFQAVLDRVSSRFTKQSPVRFTRVFARDSGAEIVDSADIEDGEYLLFSAGEDRALAGEKIVAQTVVDGKEAEKKQFLQNIATAAVVQASHIYDSTSSYLASKSPGFVKVTLEKVQGRVAPSAQTVARKVKQIGQPMLERADGLIDSAYLRVSRVSRKSRELPAEVVKTINDNYVIPVILPLKDRVHDVQHRVQDASAAFLHVAVDTWHSLQTSAQDGRVRLDSFIEGIKSKFGASWNDRLVEPAKSLYAAVQKEYTEVVHQQPDKGKIASIFDNVKHKLGDAWEQKIKANLKLPSSPGSVSDSVKSAINHRVVQPVESFYRYAWDGYRNLANSANGASVSFSDFLVSLRGRLGSAWNSQLMDPARYLYERFRGEPAALIQDDEGKSEEEEIPANTASPLPTSLDAPVNDSPRASGSTTPSEQVLYPADVDEEDAGDSAIPDAVSNAHEDVAPAVTVVPKPNKKGSAKSKSGTKKKSKNKKSIGSAEN